MKIVPALLARNSTELKKQYKHLAGLFDYLQLDICDGRFVSTRTRIRPSCLKNILKPKDKLEIHLMVSDVPRYIDSWAKEKRVKKIIWHYEALPDKEANICLVKYLKTKKIKSGLAINPATRLDKIKNLISIFDTIQIMSVTPGKQNQLFKSQALAKIKKFHRLYPTKNIAVDGGINNKNIAKIKKAAINTAAIGGYLQKLNYKGLYEFLERWTNK